MNCGCGRRLLRLLRSGGRRVFKKNTVNQFMSATLRHGLELRKYIYYVVKKQNKKEFPVAIIWSRLNWHPGRVLSRAIGVPYQLLCKYDVYFTLSARIFLARTR